jgi:LacI family transcriptional regulator
MTRLLDQKIKPTAIFVANSQMTGGALAALREQEIKVPGDMSLIGFDDAQWTRYLDPPLTTIAHPLEEMARKAADLLLNRIAGVDKGPAQRIQFQPVLMVRNSTAIVRAGVKLRP